MDIVEFAEQITGYKMLPHQVKFLTEIASDDTMNAVVKAPRGAGKTFMAAIICAYYLTHRNNYKIVIAAGSREQAGRMMGYPCNGFGLFSMFLPDIMHFSNP